MKREAVNMPKVITIAIEDFEQVPQNIAKIQTVDITVNSKITIFGNGKVEFYQLTKVIFQKGPHYFVEIFKPSMLENSADKWYRHDGLEYGGDFIERNKIPFNFNSKKGFLQASGAKILIYELNEF